MAKTTRTITAASYLTRSRNRIEDKRCTAALEELVDAARWTGRRDGTFVAKELKSTVKKFATHCLRKGR